VWKSRLDLKENGKENWRVYFRQILKRLVRLLEVKKYNYFQRGQTFLHHVEISRKISLKNHSQSVKVKGYE